ncbi:MAG: hypothetical protein R2831_02210 [Chitinophagaceae bacterium]
MVEEQKFLPPPPFRIALIIITTSVFFINCNKDNTDCKACKESPSEFITFKFIDTKIQSKYWKLSEEKNKGMIMVREIEQGVFNRLYSNIFNNLPLEKVYSIVFYTKNFPSKDLFEFNSNEIKGYSIFYLGDKNKLQHVLYKFGKGKSEIIHSAGLQVSGINTKALTYYLRNEFDANTIVLTFNERNKFTEINKKGATNAIYNFENKRLGNKQKNIDSSCGLGCGAFVANTSCQAHPIYGTLTCEPNFGPGSCPGQTIYDHQSNNNMPTLDLLELYDFRDNFLSRYDKTDMYIDFYYNFSDIYSIDDVGLLSQTYEAYQICQPIIEKLMNYDMHLSENLINAVQSSELINLFNQLKAKTTDPIKIQQIDILLNDLNAFSNMTVQEYINYIES